MFFVFTLVVAVFSMVDNPSIDEIFKSLDVNSAWMYHLVQIWKFYGVDKLRMECILVTFGQSTQKTIGILIKVFCIFSPNKVVLAVILN